MKNFGDFIKVEREKKFISQSQLALMCGFTSTTYVSRVELNKNSPTISVAEKLCSALNLDADYVYNEICETQNHDSNILDPFLQSFPQTEQQSLKDSEILQPEDIEKFKKILQRDITQGSILLSRWIARTVKQYIDHNNQENLLENNEYPGYPPEIFINSLYNNPIIPIEIKYPNLSPRIIIDIWKNDGVIIPKDAAALISGLRLQKDIPVHKLAESANLAPITLSKIEESNFQSVAIQDCLQLDSSLNANGVVFKIMLKAISNIHNYNTLEIETLSPPNSFIKISQLINDLILLTRWWYVTPIRDNSWLEQIRVDLGNS